MAGLVLSPLLSEAATIAVPADQPTIQAGLDSAVSGDTVLVAGGVYLEALDFGGKAVVLRSESGPFQTTLQPRHAESSTITIDSAASPGITISGFTFRGGSRVAVIRLGGGASVTIHNNRFTETTGPEPVIRIDSARTSITQNVFFNNQALACIGIYADSAFIYNNTLVANSRGIFALAGYGDIRNCIVANQAEYGISGDSLVSNFNVYRANTPNFVNGAGSGINDIFADPGLTAPDFHDYTLRDTSICIDAGDPDLVFFDSDSSVADIGAYPFGTVPMVLPAVVNLTLESGSIVRVTDSLPEFVWRYYDSTGTYSGYEIEVGTDNDWPVAEMWASGQQPAPDTSVLYAGTTLADGSVYTVRLRLFNGTTWGGWTPFGFATNTPPDPPALLAPVNGDSVSIDNVLLTVTNCSDLDPDSLRYDFEVYSDSTLATLVASDTGVIEQAGTTSTVILDSLLPDSLYWWRARAHDSYEFSAWSDSGSFRTFSGPRTLRVPSAYPSIKAAVMAAATGDTILVADGIYSGPDNRRISFGTRQLQLLSENGPATTIIDCADSLGTAHWGIQVASGQSDSTTIAGFTIRNASDGLIVEAKPRLRNLAFESCSIGVLAYGNFAATIDSSRWTGCETAISAEYGFDLTVRFSRLVANNTGINGLDADLAVRHTTLDSNLLAITLIATSAGLDTCQFIANDTAVRSNIGSVAGMTTVNGGTFTGNGLAMIGDVTVDAVIVTGGVTAIETVFPDRADISNSSFSGVTGTVLRQVYKRLSPPPGSAATDTLPSPGWDLIYCDIIDNPGQVAYLESGEDGDFSLLHIDSCRIIGNGGGLTVGGAVTMSRSLYAYNGGPLDYHINDWVSAPYLIDRSTFVDNDSGAIRITGESGKADISRTIIARNGGVGLSYNTIDGTVGSLNCNNVYDNAGGNYAVVPDPTGTDGNISEIVRFCATDSLDYTLYDISACAPLNNSCSTLIGAYDVVCNNEIPTIFSPDTVAVIEDSLLTWIVAFTDIDGPDTTITITGIPSWLTLSNDTLSGVPTEGIGDTSFTIMIDDGFAADTTVVAVLVTPVDDPPVLDSIADQFVVELDTLQVLFGASDVDSDSLVLKVAPLPSGAFVIDSGNGRAVLNWPVDTSRAGLYSVFFIASDTQVADTEIVAITVQSRRPTVTELTIDGIDTAQHVVSGQPLVCWGYVDSAYGFAQTQFEIAVGVDTDWQFAEIWNPNPFESADTCVTLAGAPLEDGVTYYLRLRVRNDTLFSPWYEESFRMNTRPLAPAVLSPAGGEQVTTLQPVLTVDNGSDADGDALQYEFAVFADSALDSLVMIDPLVPESPDSTSNTVTLALTDNQTYWWRARTFDAYEYSEWSDSASFFIDESPQPPQPFVLLENPVDSGTIVYDMLPTYRWSRSDDPDPYDTVRYRILLSRDSFTGDTIMYDSIPDTVFTVPDSLAFASEYEWRLEAFDGSGLTTESSERLYFYTWILGDINHSRIVNLTDLTRLVNALFVTFEPIVPYFIADLDGSCTVNLTDIQILVNYLFLDGLALAPGCAPPVTSGAVSGDDDTGRPADSR